MILYANNMNNSNQHIGKLIRIKRSRLSKLRSLVRGVKAEIAALEKARPRRARAKPRKSRKGLKRVRSISKRWKEVLIYIGKAGSEGISIQEIMNYCNQAKLAISEESVRSNMTLYGKKGLIHRVKKNAYALTEEGAKAAHWSRPVEGNNVKRPEDFLRT